MTIFFSVFQDNEEPMETDTASNNGNDAASNSGNDSPVLIFNIFYAVTPHHLLRS